jgi:hypothetical protein
VDAAPVVRLVGVAHAAQPVLALAEHARQIGGEVGMRHQEVEDRLARAEPDVPHLLRHDGVLDHVAHQEVVGGVELVPRDAAAGRALRQGNVETRARGGRRRGLDRRRGRDRLLAAREPAGERDGRRDEEADECEGARHGAHDSTSALTVKATPC